MKFINILLWSTFLVATVAVFGYSLIMIADVLIALAPRGMEAFNHAEVVKSAQYGGSAFLASIFMANLTNLWNNAIHRSDA